MSSLERIPLRAVYRGYSRVYTSLLNQTGLMGRRIHHSVHLTDLVPDFLLAKLEEKGQLTPPIKLAGVLDDLCIDQPISLHDYLPYRSADIGWSQEKSRFVINLRKSLLKPEESRSDNEDWEEQLSLNGRFTLGHELAHRFFFVPDGSDGYSRAVNGVLKSIEDRNLRALAKYRLHNEEEYYCNTISRKTLIPAEMAADFIKAQTQGEDIFPRFGSLVQQLAEHFQVSITSTILAVNEAFKSGYLPKIPDLLAIYIGGYFKDGSLYSVNCLGGIGPYEFEGLSINKPLIIRSSGANAKAYGVEFDERMVKILSSKGFDESKPINTSLRFEKHRFLDPPHLRQLISLNLKGYWYPLNNTGAFKSGLIWGHLSQEK